MTVLRFRNQLWLAWRQTRRRLFESFLIVLAIGLGVSVIIAVLSMFVLIEEQERVLWDTDYYRAFEISEPPVDMRDFTSPLSPVVPVDQAQRVQIKLEDLREFKQLLPEGYLVFMESRLSMVCPLLEAAPTGSPESGYPGWENYVEILSLTPDAVVFHDYKLQDGQWFVEDDVMYRNRVAVIGDKLAARIFGDQNPIGRTVPLMNYLGEEMLFTVIGVVQGFAEDYGEDSWKYWEDPGQWLLIPLNATEPANVEVNYGWFTVGVLPGIDVGQAYHHIKRAAELYFEEEMQIYGSYLNWLEYQKQTGFFAKIIGLFASIGLLIAVLNILNLFLARVLRRTPQIGISKALGASAASVFAQFLWEAFLLGVAGAVVGIGLSFLMVKPLQGLTGSELVVETSAVGIGIGIALATSLLFGVYPAYQAAKIDPVEALRTE